MHYTIAIAIDAFHIPSREWHPFHTTHGLRAVSRKHALTKGLKIATAFPVYADREGHPDWKVYAEVHLTQE